LLRANGRCSLVSMLSASELTQKLVQFNTCNPGEKEGDCISFLQSLLDTAGFKTVLQDFEPGRPNLIARSQGAGNKAALCFAGHIDTVPLGSVPWSQDPFAANIVDGNLYGRGSTDMKSGIAAMVIAAIKTAQETERTAEIVLAIVVAEETGCEGSFHLAGSPELLGDVGALIVTEPSENEIKIAHRGICWMKARARGIAAHGARPDLGDNAIYRLATAALQLRDYQFPVQAHDILGLPSINVGILQGGNKVNIVPDSAFMEIDIRTLPSQSEKDVLNQVQALLGDKIELETILALPSVATDLQDPWVQSVFSLTDTPLPDEPKKLGLPYFTDASALTPALGNVPTLLIGPGELKMLHKVDEYAQVSHIEACAEKLATIARAWCKG